MAIRVRRGDEEDFDPTKLKSGEFAACEDTSKVYIKCGTDVIELTSVREIGDIEGLEEALEGKSDTTHKHTSDDIAGLVSGGKIGAEAIVDDDGNAYINFGVKSDIAPATSSFRGVKYIGHRGLSGIAPENTIPAFTAAGTHGMWGAECDIWETADGNFAVCHNATVDAATNGSGNIADLTLDEVKALTVDAWNNIAQYPDLKMPTLQEYLDCCKVYGIVPVIEIKNMSDTVVPSFVEIVRNKGFEDTAVVLSIDHDTLNLIRTISDVNLQYLFNASNFSSSNYKEQIDTVSAVDNADIDILYSTVTQEVVNYAHSLGVKVNVWTVDDPTTAREMLDMGVDFITTDILIDSSALPQKPVDRISVDSATDAATVVTSDLSVGTSTATTETLGNTGVHFFNATTGVLSINSGSTGGLHCNFGCYSGDVIAVEYEYYPVSSTPKLTIGSYELDPPETYSYDTAWQPVKLAIPIMSNSSIDINIGGVTGIYRLRNVSVTHVKYHSTLDTSTETQEWITASLTSPAEHYSGNEVKYCKRDGLVYIRGWFTGWESAINNQSTSVLFTLPEGYRPAQEMNFAVNTSGITAGNAYFARFQVRTDGTVRVGAESVSGGVANGCSACIPPFIAEN